MLHEFHVRFTQCVMRGIGQQEQKMCFGWLLLRIMLQLTLGCCMVQHTIIMFWKIVAMFCICICQDHNQSNLVSSFWLLGPLHT
jgi:hypothetical protein